MSNEWMIKWVMNEWVMSNKWVINELMNDWMSNE